jgi:hypothetical protein
MGGFSIDNTEYLFNENLISNRVTVRKMSKTKLQNRLDLGRRSSAARGRTFGPLSVCRPDNPQSDLPVIPYSTDSHAPAPHLFIQISIALCWPISFRSQQNRNSRYTAYTHNATHSEVAHCYPFRVDVSIQFAMRHVASAHADCCYSGLYAIDLGS